jgi:hypothetical protein
MELRDTLDACLEKNMWFFSIGELLLLPLLLLLLPSMQMHRMQLALDVCTCVILVVVHVCRRLAAGDAHLHKVQSELPTAANTAGTHSSSIFDQYALNGQIAC